MASSSQQIECRRVGHEGKLHRAKSASRENISRDINVSRYVISRVTAHNKVARVAQNALRGSSERSVFWSNNITGSPCGHKNKGPLLEGKEGGANSIE